MTYIIAVGEVNMSYNMLSQKMNKEQRLFALLCGSCFVFPVIFLFSFNHFSFKRWKGKKKIYDIVWSIHKEDKLLWTNIYIVQTCFLEYKKYQRIISFEIFVKLPQCCKYHSERTVKSPHIDILYFWRRLGW